MCVDANAEGATNSEGMIAKAPTTAINLSVDFILRTIYAESEAVNTYLGRPTHNTNNLQNSETYLPIFTLGTNKEINLLDLYLESGRLAELERLATAGQG